MCFIRFFLQRYEKRFIADIPACIDIDFSLFNKESVMLGKRNIKDFKMGYFVYLSKNKIQ